MKLFTTFGTKSACLALGLCALATLASASEVRMQVPVEARWGNKVLPAGNYVVRTDPGSPFIRVSGNGKNVTILATSIDATQDGVCSYVELVPGDGVPTVKALASQGLGRFIEFKAPKGSATRVSTSEGTAGL